MIIRESIVSAAVLILPSPMQVITARTPLIFRNFSTMQMVMVLFLIDHILELIWVDNHQSADIREHITELQLRIYSRF